MQQTVVSCRVVSCRVVSCRVVSCRVVSCRVVSCRVVSCHVMSCHASLQSCLTNVALNVCLVSCTMSFFGLLMEKYKHRQILLGKREYLLLKILQFDVKDHLLVVTLSGDYNFLLYEMKRTPQRQNLV